MKELMRKERIVEALKPYFEKLSGSGVFFWIAGGSVLSVISNEKSRDVDLFFRSKEDCQKMKDYCKEKLGFEWVKGWATATRLLSDEMEPWDFWFFPSHQELTVSECISYFDFRVCAVAVSSTGDLYYAKETPQDFMEKKLVYTGNHYHLSNGRHSTCIKRLKQYLDRGYTLDNLDFWISENNKRTPLINGDNDWHPVQPTELQIIRE